MLQGKPPQTIEIDDLNIPQPNPPLIKTVEEPTVPQMEQDEPTKVAQLMETTAGLQRSARVKFQPKNYERTMRGSKYSYAITQLETHGVLHPDSHMFVQEDFYQSGPNVVAHVMTQLSLKSGLKRWGNKAYAAVTSEMKQLHFRNMFRPKHWNELSKT
jgi:type IV secretory pathway VirB10-like protein